MPDFPIFDAHVHLCNIDTLKYGWTAGAPQLGRNVSPTDYFKAAGPVAIEKFVFVEVDVDKPLHIDEARWVQGLATTTPQLGAIVASAPLENGLAVEPDLIALKKNPLVRGVRRLLQGEADARFCLRPEFISGVKLLAKHDLSFDICIYHHQMGSVIELVKQCPEVRFVLDHIGKPGIKTGLLQPWWSEIEALAKFPNVWCKISGVVTEADHKAWTPAQVRPYVEHAISCFGFDRAMFGSDWHVQELAATYPQWVEIVDDVVRLASDNEKRKLFRDTAKSFYRLA
jgi:L-fuconolactonase